MITAATLTFGPGLMADDAPSRAGRRKTTPPVGTNSLASMELLARARSGDEAAINELCARYIPRLQKWAHGRLPARARGALDTFDLVQDTFMHVVQRLAAFEPQHDGAFFGYLRTTLANRITDQIRRTDRRPTDPLSSDFTAAGPTQFELAVGREVMERYEAALQRLDPPDREAIIARVELRLPYEEVARALGKPTIPAAHVAVSRALVKLAKEMAHVRCSRS